MTEFWPVKCGLCNVSYFLAWPIKPVILQLSPPLFQQPGKFIFKTSGLEDKGGPPAPYLTLHEQQINL